MRSLVVTPTPTHPTNQGNRARVHQVAHALRRLGPVEVLYYALDGLDDGILAAMRQAWDLVHVVAPGEFRPQRRRPSHWGIDEWVGPQLMQAVRALAAATAYDVVLVNYVWCSWVLTAFPGGTLRVIDTHDAFGDRHQLTRAAGMPAHWFYTTRVEEAAGFDRADVVLAIQPEEGRQFAAMTRARVVVAEYAAPPAFLPWRGARRPLAVGYLGSGNPWNVETLRQFDALLAGRGVPDGCLLLALGGVTRKAAGLRAFQPGGEVDAVADAYAALDIVVNPMRGGTGLKIKTVEALAHGRVVLSTKDGGLGLEAVHPDLLHADAEALADRLLELLAAPERLGDLATEMQAGYRAFHAEVDARWRALVDGWAGGEK